jgi:hypothetical protein
LTKAIFKYCSFKPDTISESEFYICQKSKAKIQPMKLSDFEIIKDNTFGKLTMIRNRNLDLSYSFSYKFEWIHSTNRTFKNNINRFLNFIKHNLAIYRGISQNHFQQYFGILLIRYNSNERMLFEIAVKSIKSCLVVETTTC